MNELILDFRQGDGKFLYTQIYEYIKKEIRKGKLLKGEKLPSTRSLAEFLQISRSTVELAYEQLLSEGYIESRPYKGYYICSAEELLELEGRSDKDYSLAERTFEMQQGKEVRESENDSMGQYEYDFSPSAIDMMAFPFATWKKITKNILVDANSEMFAAGSPKGDFALRETIGRYLHSSRGVNCTPDQIIVGAGNDYLLMLLEKILGRHVRIAMENPTYKRAYKIFDSFAYKIIPIEVDAFGMKVEELKRSSAQIAYVMPSHQYPTGAVMPIGRRMELLKWAGEDGRYLIEDDYDSEFRFKGKPIPSLQASDRNGKVIYIGTFSKSIAPAIRISYMVLPKNLLNIYEKNCSFYSTTVSRIDQRILNEFIKDGYFERHLNKMRKIYREKHDTLLEELKSLSGQFMISDEDAGLHILLHSTYGRKEEELIETAKKAGVKVYSFADAFIGRNAITSNTVILGFAGLNKEQLTKGIGKLKKVWG